MLSLDWHLWKVERVTVPPETKVEDMQMKMDRVWGDEIVAEIDAARVDKELRNRQAVGEYWVGNQMEVERSNHNDDDSKPQLHDQACHTHYRQQL